MYKITEEIRNHFRKKMLIVSDHSLMVHFSDNGLFII